MNRSWVAAGVAFMTGCLPIVIGAIARSPAPDNPLNTLSLPLASLLVPLFGGLILVPGRQVPAVVAAATGYAGLLASYWAPTIYPSLHPSGREIGLGALMWTLFSPLGIAVVWGLIQVVWNVRRRLAKSKQLGAGVL